MSLFSLRVLPPLLLITLHLVSECVSADVIWDNCIIPENIYVTKHDSTRDFAEMKGHIEGLDYQIGKYKMSMHKFLHGDTWGSAKERFYFNHSSPRVSFFAVIIDPKHKNISLMITSEHQEENFSWVGDNQIFIDGNTNRFADFVCSGPGLYLTWKGRDMQAVNEFFDSANGALSAKLENYTNSETGQDFYLLRMAELENDYPHDGLYGRAMRLYKSIFNHRTPYPHYRYYRYNHLDPDCSPETPKCMMPMMRPGYDAIDRTRTAHDAAKLDYYHYETSTQNNYSRHKPVSISTIRAHLMNLRTNLRADTLNFTHTAFQGKSIHDMIREADQAVASGLEAKDKSFDQDYHYKAAGDQLIELEALVSNNRGIIDNARDGVRNMTGEMYQSEMLIPMINEMVKSLNEARLASMLSRQAVNEADILNSEINPQIIPKHKLEYILEGSNDEDENSEEPDSEEASTESDEYERLAKDDYEELAKDDYEELAKDSVYDIPVSADDAVGCQLTSGGQIATYRPRRGDNRFNFNIGISVRVSEDSQKPMILLQSTKTPWKRRLYGDRDGVDYIIPESDIWCRGALFGVDHVSGWPNTGVLRITLRGIYDNVRKEMYVGSMWSTWDQNWALSYLLSAYSAITPIGGYVASIAGIAAVSPAFGALGIGLLGMTAIAANTTLTMLTPYVSREVRWPHGKVLDSLFMDPVMGNHYSHGNLNMKYYSTFGTLESDGNIH